MRKDTSKTIKKAAYQAADTVKKAAETVAEKAPEVIESVADKAEDFMNHPVVEKAMDKVEDAAEKVTRAVRTRISDVTIEIFETTVTLDAIEKAVKADAAAKKLKGEIKIYVNAEERAAYYTVNGEGDGSNKIDLRFL